MCATTRPAAALTAEENERMDKKITEEDLDELRAALHSSDELTLEMREKIAAALEELYGSKESSANFFRKFALD